MGDDVKAEGVGALFEGVGRTKQCLDDFPELLAGLHARARSLTMPNLELWAAPRGLLIVQCDSDRMFTVLAILDFEAPEGIGTPLYMHADLWEQVEAQEVAEA